MQQRYDGSFFHFALAYSLRHRSVLQGDVLAADVEARHAELAEASLEKQRMIEAREQMPFESYRQQYLAPESLRAE